MSSHGTWINHIPEEVWTTDSVTVHDVLYVPELQKNLISVSSLEDNYVVTFKDGRVFIRPKHSKTMRMIGVREGKIYKLQFEVALRLVQQATLR